MKLIIPLVLIAFIPFFGYVPSSMSIEPFINIDLYNEMIFGSYDSRYYQGQHLNNFSFYVFAIFFNALNTLKINPLYIGYIWYCSIFIIGGIGINKFLEYISNKEKNDLIALKKNIIIIFYLFNYYSITQIDNGYLIFPYLILPGLAYYALKVIECISLKNVLLLLIYSNLNTTQLTLNIINLFVISIFVYHYYGLKNLLKILSLILFFSSWFWGNYIYLAINPTPTLEFASKDEDFTFYNRTTSFFEIIRLLGNWAITDSALPISKYLDKNIIGISVSFIPIFIFLLAWKNNSIKFKLALIILIILAMGNNQTSPFYYLVNFSSDYVSYINVFRNTYKFVGGIILILCINYLFLKNKIYIYMVLIYSIYSILGLYFVKVHPPESRFYGVPSYWKDIETYIKTNVNSTDSILLLPFENNSIYEWGSYNGFVYGTPMSIKNPILFKTLSSTNNEIVNKIRNDFIEQNPCNLLIDKKIAIIINRNDLISKEYYNIKDLDCGFDYKKFGPLEFIRIRNKIN